MAILWEQRTREAHYKVTQAGNTRRLYKNGVFHSQYNPQRITTGGIWDLMSLPSLLLPPDNHHQALVLGVGGGAVLHQLCHMPHINHITGIEKDNIHLQIAKKFFGLQHKKISLHQGCAIAWMNTYDNNTFDIIIDDLFYEEEGEPKRAITIDKTWLDTLLSHLSETGLLIINTVQAVPLRKLALASEHQLKTAFKLSMPNYYNQIHVFSKQTYTLNTLRTLVKTHAIFNKAAKHRPISYSARNINMT